MFNKLTESLFSHTGHFRNDILPVYQKNATVLDFSERPLEPAITRSLKILLGKRAMWKFVQKGIWSGNTHHSYVTKVSHKDRIYYFKLTNKASTHVGPLIAQAYHTEFPIKNIQIAPILEHGTIHIENNQSYLFSLVEKATGKVIADLFQDKEYDTLKKFYASVGKTLGSIHSQNISTAKPIEKYRYSQMFLCKEANIIFNQLQENLIPEGKKILNQYIEEITPMLLLMQEKYLRLPQKKCLATSLSTINNVSYQVKTNMITLFDSSEYTSFCGPKEKPKWAPEDHFSEFLCLTDLATGTFNLDPQVMEQCKEAFLERYFDSANENILSPEGVHFFMSLGFFYNVMVLVERSHEDPQYISHAEKFIQQFHDFDTNGDKLINKYLTK